MPKAEEVISYQIPAFRLPSGLAHFFAGWKNHFSLYPVHGVDVKALKADAKKYTFAKGTMRCSYDEKVPAALIERLAKLRAAKTDARVKAREKKKPQL